MNLIEVVLMLSVICAVLMGMSYGLALLMLEVLSRVRRYWYRWRGRRAFSQADRISLDAVARMERKS